MAFSAAEEARLRSLLGQDSAILSLAGNEALITSSLGAAQVTLSGLGAASALADSDLLLVRQGSTDKSITAALAGAPFRNDAGLRALVGLSPAADLLPYFTGATSSAVTSFTPVARGLLDDSSYSAMLTTLGFTADAKALVAASYAAMRTQLNLVVGTDVQAFDSDLAAIAALATTAYGRGLLALADATGLSTALGMTYSSNANGHYIGLRVAERTYYLQMMEQVTGSDGWSSDYDLPIAFGTRGWIVATSKTVNASATSGNTISADLVGLTKYHLGNDDNGNRACAAIAIGY